jgi:hypothetical protein
MSEDPIGFAGDDTNLNRYVKNNVFILDTMGLTMAPHHTCTILSCKNFCNTLPERFETITPDGPEEIAYPRRECQIKCDSYQVQFNTWYNSNRDITWTESLDLCPCTIKKMPKVNGLRNMDFNCQANFLFIADTTKVLIFACVETQMLKVILRNVVIQSKVISAH